MNMSSTTTDNECTLKSLPVKRSFRKWLSSTRRSPRHHNKKHDGPKETAFAKNLELTDYSDDNISLATTVVSTTSSTGFHQDSPQEHLNAILSSRGYSTKTYPALESGYFNKPTQLQKASYTGYIMNLIRKDDEKTQETFRTLLSSGISTNPCDFSGESVLHAVCRRGNHTLARIMLDEHPEVTVQIADDFGRTPLAVACWSTTPSFKTVKLILDHDVHLVQLVDARGSTPLSYVPQEQWPVWIDFLNQHCDHYWPDKNNAALLYEEQTAEEQDVPPLTLVKPNSCRFPSPANALMLELAALVAGGKMNRAEAECLRYDTEEAALEAISNHDSQSKELSYSSSNLLNAATVDDDDDDDANQNSFFNDGDDSSSFSWDQADMNELLEGISN